MTFVNTDMGFSLPISLKSLWPLWSQGEVIAQPSLPHTVIRRVFHGTSEGAWEDIQASNTLHAGRRKGISFTHSANIAEEFARLSACRDYCERGVVISFDLDALSAAFDLIPYRDQHATAVWRAKDEQEMKAMTGLIPDALLYVVAVYLIEAD